MELSPETSFGELFNILALEGHIQDHWKYDNNTTLLLIVKDFLAGLLKATLQVTNNFQDTQQINAIGIVQGVSEILNGIMDNIQLIDKDGTNHGTWKH